MRLRYTAVTRPGSENELFVRIKHDDQRIYFPLDTEIPEKAALRAREIYRTILNEGWNVARQQFVRQIIWAIYWFTEPLASTYGTLFTVVDAKNPTTGSPQNGQTVPVILVESEPEVRAGLKQCLNRMPGYTCMQTPPTAADLLRLSTGAGSQPKLVLYNQFSLNLATGAFHQQLQARWPGMVAIPYDIFSHSDEIFITATGMDRGYYLRRRSPLEILEPLNRFWEPDSASHGPLRNHLRAYFQKLIIEDLEPDNIGALSEREAEILRCLSTGHTNKTIATQLGISVWTVHTHVKSIFKKLNVHTRAEAVTRHLQK